MQTVLVQVDWYTKFVLTLIAVLLAGILVKPHIATRPVSAYNDRVTVDNHSPIPVEIKNFRAVKVSVENWPRARGEAIPVEIRCVRPSLDVSAYITGSNAPLRVVDWKEEKDYQEHSKQEQEGKSGKE